MKMNKIKKTVGVVALLAAVALSACSENSKTSETSNSQTEAVKEVNSEVINKNDELLTGLHHVVLDIKDYGQIELELDADVAPVSVTNFINLANKGYYDGLTFHRIISDFMMQGGDGSAKKPEINIANINGEFWENGIENNISHKRGVISMARSAAYDSASSQFFICREDSEFLDGQYAAFGHVTSGMDVVDAICVSAPVIDNNGTVPLNNQPVMNSVKVID